MTEITVTPLSTHRNERPYPFCPGCGHSSILDALDAALVKRDCDPSKVVLVSDIGCSGLSDQYFRTSAFHGLHGRSIRYATGIKLARPELDVIVIMGDGGTGIGGAHLLAAARRNIGITVLVMDNLNFGMTGGQHSTTTPLDGMTPTTPAGNLERPLDICATVGINGAQFVWRGTSFDGDLSIRIADAMSSDGFALLDIWELCTAHYVRRNSFTRRAIRETLDDLQLETGVLFDRSEPEFAAEYRRRAETMDPPPRRHPGIATRFVANLSDRADIIVAGGAGGRVRSAAHLVGEAAISAGLWAAQQDDYPITVKTGHSVSTLVLSTRQIAFPGITAPDLAIVTAPEGKAKIGRKLAAMSPDGLVLTTPELIPISTPASVVALDPKAASTPLAKADLALALLAAGIKLLDLFPVEALHQRAHLVDPRFSDRAVDVVRAGRQLAG